MAFDYSTLSPDQKAVARKVYLSAQKYGMDPNFVVPMVMAESKFVHGPSDRKDKNGKPISFGVMPMVPGTAKRYGVDDYTGVSVDDNIDAGMRHLKDLVSDPKIGNDPKKVIAAYNAGAGTPFIKTSDEKDLPSETKAHMANVQKFAASDALPAPAAAAPVSNHDSLEQGEEIGSNLKVDEEAQKRASALEDPDAEEVKSPEVAPTSAAFPGAVAGALFGAAVSGGKNVVAPIVSAAQHALGMESKKIVPDTSARVEPALTEAAPVVDPLSVEGKATAMAEMADSTPGGKWGGKTGYGIGSGTVQQASARYQRKVNKGKVSGPLDKLYGPALPGEDTQLSQRLIDRANAAETNRLAQQQADAEAAATARNKQQLGERSAAEENYKNSWGGRLSNLAADVARGTLSGAGFGYGAQAAQNAYNQGNNTEAALHGTSAGASALDLASTFLPSAGKTAVQRVTGPLAILANSGADVARDVNNKDYPGALGSAAIGASTFIPGVGIPTATYLQWAKDNPEKAAQLREETSGYANFMGP
jgi:hypothetical protein